MFRDPQQMNQEDTTRQPGGFFLPAQTGTPTKPLEVKPMNTESVGAVAGAAFFKFLPAALGAGIMAMVAPPTTKKELFMRAFVALAMSFLFGEFVFDLLRSDVFAWLNPFERKHTNAVDGFVGAVGWFFAGGLGTLLEKWKSAPFSFIDYFFTKVLAFKGAPAADAPVALPPKDEAP